MDTLPPNFTVQPRDELPEGFAVPAEPKPTEPTGWRLAGDIAAAPARGAMMGYGDEAAAAIAATFRPESDFHGQGDTWKKRYDMALQAIRQRNKEFDESYPVTSGTLRAGGTIAATAIPAAAGARVALPVLGRYGTAAGIGAVEGAVAGFGEGEGGLENRAVEAGKGAGIGAVAAPALLGAAEAGGSVYRSARNLVGGGDPEKKAAALLNRALTRDKTTPETVAQAVEANRASRIPSDVVDAAGENTTALARMTASAPGEARNRGLDWVRRRGQENYTAVNDALLRAVDPADFATAKQTLIDRLTTGSRKAYEDMFASAPMVKTSEIDDILNTPHGRRALRDVMSRVEPGKRSSLGPVRDTPDGPVVEKYYLEALHEVKKELWDMGRRAKASALTGGDTSQSGYFKSLSGKLGDALKRAHDDYRKVSADWADEAHLMEALEKGREFARLRPNEIKTALKEFTPSEREMALTGYYDALEMGVLGSTRTTANLGAKILDTPAIATRMEAVLGPKEFGRFMDRARRLSGMFDTTRIVGSRAGSQTQPRLADLEDTGAAEHLMDAALAKATGHELSFAANMMGVGRKILGRTADKAKGLDEQTAEVLSRTLLSNPDDAVKSLMALNPSLSKASAGDLVRKLRNQVLATGVATGTTNALAR